MIPMMNEPGGGERAVGDGLKGRSESIIERMVIDMNDAQVRTLEQVRQVLEGTQSLEFRRAEDEEGRYAWIGECPNFCVRGGLLNLSLLEVL